MSSACIATPTKRSSCTASPSKRNARRCLFGRSDPIATNKWLSDKLKEALMNAQEKYGYDFVQDCPLPGTSDYDYIAIIDSSAPEFYRNKFINSSTTSSPSKENSFLNTSTGSSISSADESDLSMDFTLSPIEPSKRTCATPKKRQGKVTDMFQVQRKKRLQRSPKSLDIVLPSRRSYDARV
ncbi:unnamed protein product [Auanema sp. JU1783]|nr:unnamed protein product [Auanema sp. JU1783]